MTLRRSLLIVLAASSGLALLVGLAYGARDAAITWLVLAGPGALALTVAHEATGPRRPGRLQRQFELTAAVAVGQLVITTVGAALLMFVSAHDALLAAVVVALAGVVGLRTAQLLAVQVRSDVDSLRSTLLAVGEGAREPAPVPPSGDELSALTRATNETIARLDETERARRDLVAAVSHDLRTPIASLRVLAEAVQDGVATGEDRPRYLGQMRTHLGALSALIDDLFELSRLEAGDIRFSLERVGVEDLLDETVEAMRPEADARGVHVRARIVAGTPAARGNPERLQRVLFNLIQNAIRHTPADGSITVSAEAADDRVEVEVADTGPGIALEDRGRVFEPFYRGGQDASRTTEGAGLGLAVSRAIVEAHGGRMWLEEAARGTRVRFSLPRA